MKDPYGLEPYFILLEVRAQGDFTAKAAYGLCSNSLAGSSFCLH